MNTTADRVKAIVIVHLGVTAPEVRADAKLGDDLQADSLDRIELMMACEEEFGIHISDPEAERVVTVREMVALVDVKLAEQAGRRSA